MNRPGFAEGHTFAGVEAYYKPRGGSDYNDHRPHSALGYLTPRAFASTFTATDDRLRNPDQLRRTTIAHPAQQRETHLRTLASAG